MWIIITTIAALIGVCHPNYAWYIVFCIVIARGVYDFANVCLFRKKRRSHKRRRKA